MERYSKSVLLKEIKALGLSTRSYRCITCLEIKTIGDLVKFTESDLLKIKNFGAKSLDEVTSRLGNIGLRLGIYPFNEGQLNDAQKLFLNKNIESCNFSIRSLKCLRNLGIKTISDLIKKNESELIKEKNFGAKSLYEIKSLLSKFNMFLGMSIPHEELKNADAVYKDAIYPTYPIFQGTPHELKHFEKIEPKLLELNLSFCGFKDNEIIFFRKQGIDKFIDLLYVSYQRVLLIFANTKKAEKIVGKASLFLDKLINESKLECKLLHDWLLYAKSELSSDQNFERIFKSKKYMDIFKRRYCKKKGETFREIGRVISLSPERVRQICSNVLDVLYKSLIFPFRIFIDTFISEFHKNKRLVAFDGCLDIIESFAFRLFNLIVSHRDERITFDNKAKVWRENSNDLLIKIEKFLEKRLKKGDELSRNQIESLALEFILENDLTHYNQSAISSLFITYHFNDYEEKFFYKKIEKAKIFENIIKNYFPEGIAIYKKKDVFFETLKSKGYSNIIDISEQTILHLAVDSENIVLWDWGVYIHKDNITINEDILDRVEKWVQVKLTSNIPRVSLFGAFFEFEHDCKRAGIQNEHALYTCMKLKYNSKFSFLKAPYVSLPKTKKRVESFKVLENYLLGFKDGIGKSQIKAGLGLRDYQVAQRINDSDKILPWDYGKVIHTDNIYFNSDDLIQIDRWIKRNIDKYNHLSILRVFEDNIVLCKKNKISGARKLYSVINKYYGSDSFLLPGYPLILNKNHGIADDGFLSLNDLVNHYFSSKGEIITKLQLNEYFVKERGYRRGIIDIVTDICDDIIKYTQNSFVSLKTIGWSDKKALALENIALEKFKRDSQPQRPFSFVEDLLEMELLPSLDGNISWQKTLLIELLELVDNIKLLGTKKEIYVFVPNQFGIETTEDLIHYVLKNEFGGAANKNEFTKRLNELRIAKKINLSEYTGFTVKNEEVFIT